MKRRCFEGEKVELREGPDGKNVIRGYAAVFNQPAYGEVIMAGAFTKTLNDGADVRALWNHDSNIVLGRTKAGTLELGQDDHGLWYEIDPPDWSGDIRETIRRGDVDQSSFGFDLVNSASITVDEEKICEIREVKLYDVSPVTFPWYEGTEVLAKSMEVRSVGGEVRTVAALVKDFEDGEGAFSRRDAETQRGEEGEGKEEDKGEQIRQILADITARFEEGLMTRAQIEALENAITEQRDDLDTTLGPGPATHPDAGTIDLLLRRLKLKAKQ